MTTFQWLTASLVLASSVAEGSSLRSASRLSAAPQRSEQKSSFPHPRQLLEEEEDQLRQFVGDAVMRIPDIAVSQETWLGMADLNVTDFRCFNVSFGDIFLGLNMVEDSAESDTFQLQVTDLLFQCTMGISWAYGRLDGAGDVNVVSDKNFLSAQMATERNADTDTTVDVNSCEGTEIAIADLEFTGDMSLKALNLYRGFIRRVAEAQVEKIFCQMMSDEMLGYALDTVEQSLQGYSSANLDFSYSDPLYLESSTATIAREGDGSSDFLNLQNDSQAAALVDLALSNLNSIFSVRKNDTNAPTDDLMDYGINTILREKLLVDRIGVFYGEVLAITENTPLVDINVTISDIKISGLDTAIVISPVTVIGSSTVQGQFQWPSISVEATIMVAVSASSDPDSIFENPDALAPIVETVIATAGVDNVNATVSLMLPLNRSQVEELPMGYILNWESLPPCIPPILYDTEISGIDVTVGDIHEPVILGIVSQDIDTIVQTSAQIGLASFQDSIIQAIPNIFQTTVRDQLQSVIPDLYCPEDEDTEGESVRTEGVRRLAEESGEERATGRELYFNLVCVVVCVCTAALAAGLTMGLLSIDELMLLIKQRAGATEKERKEAASLLPIVRQHHLLLVSLLLMNALANEALPLFLDKIVPGYMAVIVSVTLVLFFGEIIPSAVFTGPNQISLASKLAPLVRTVMFVLSPIAYPIAKTLDRLLHEEHGSMYNRGELSALVRIQYEDHLASKRRRKAEMNHDLKRLEGPMDSTETESFDSYAIRRSSRLSKSNMSEIKTTIRAMKRTMSQKQGLHVDEVSMVEGALQMRTAVATEVFSPWDRVFAIPSDMILNERNAVRIYRSGYSRIPVYLRNDDDPDDNTKIIGILSARQLIVVDSQDERQVSTLPLAIPRCVGPDTSLVDMINLFQSGGVTGSHLALITRKPHLADRALRVGEPIPDDAGLMG